MWLRSFNVNLIEWKGINATFNHNTASRHQYTTCCLLSTTDDGGLSLSFMSVLPVKYMAKDVRKKVMLKKHVFPQERAINVVVKGIFIDLKLVKHWL